MIFYYTFSYDETSNDFFAFVDSGTKESACIFQIDDTKEIIDYINTGVMKHIDDVEGLAAHLIKQEILKEGDTMVCCPKMLW